MRARSWQGEPWVPPKKGGHSYGTYGKKPPAPIAPHASIGKGRLPPVGSGKYYKHEGKLRHSSYATGTEFMGKTGKWVTKNHHHIFIPDKGTNNIKGHIEAAAHATNPTSPYVGKVGPMGKQMAKNFASDKGETGSGKKYRKYFKGLG